MTVSAKEWVPRGKVTAYVADVGTPMPSSLDEPLPSDWRDVHDEFGVREVGAGELEG